MEQFRQIGEVLGSLKALMVLKHEITINPRQCSLLFDMLELSFTTISDEIKQNLKLEDRNTKWKPLELPMKELHRIFKEADFYIRHCIDIKEWWGRAISLHMNKDCVELHIHNLLCCFPVVIEAIETSTEIYGVNEEDMQRRRNALMRKYSEECDDVKFFQWKFGRQYLVPRDVCNRLETAWREDRWLLLEKIMKKNINNVPLLKQEQRLVELLVRKLNHTDYNTLSKEKLLPSSVLVGAQDYYVKRRLGYSTSTSGARFKEIQWLGESFALRTFFGDIGPLHHEISSILALSHPNVLQYHCAFYDEDRKEGFLVMELMSKDLGTYIKENSGQRKRIPFSLPVAVDVMLQIARGMEYLHSKKIYHGDLHPSKILLKPRSASSGGLFQAKVTGFGLNSIKSYGSKSPKPNPNEDPLDIWLAPEVMAELERSGSKSITKYSEKADVYSFGMLCFELLTGKVPFEDGHLQGVKMVRNIRAGERPLFSYPSPKYLANLTKKCWQTNPTSRPSFSSICRILRYIKKIIVIDPDHGHPDSPPPLVDYCDMEAGYLKRFTNGPVGPVSQIPFEIFAYKLVEKEKIPNKKWDLCDEGFGKAHRPASMFDVDEHLAEMDDLFLAPSDRRSVCSEIIGGRKNLAVDLRSVTSEIPHRKLCFDQRSFGSDLSPGKRVFSISDQRPVGGETSEKKVNQRLPIEKKDDQCSKLKVEIPANKAIVAETKKNGYKSPSAKLRGQKLESNEVIETKMLPKPGSSETAEGKISTRAIGHTKLAEIPEKKILKNGESIQVMESVSSRTCDMKNESTSKKNHDNAEKKPMLIRKLMDTKNKNLADAPNNDSPKSSPARTTKTNAMSSPASSPGRMKKTNATSSPARMKKTNATSSPSSSPARTKKTNPTSSPASSPARMKKTKPGQSPASSPARMKKPYPSESPASSPARVFHTCSSPIRAQACEHPSPTSSQLNPLCTRCSRLGKSSSQPASMTLLRPRMGHVPESGSPLVCTSHNLDSHS